jgi:hypothetical protein
MDEMTTQTPASLVPTATTNAPLPLGNAQLAMDALVQQAHALGIYAQPITSAAVLPAY